MLDLTPPGETGKLTITSVTTGCPPSTNYFEGSVGGDGLATCSGTLAGNDANKARVVVQGVNREFGHDGDLFETPASSVFYSPA